MYTLFFFFNDTATTEIYSLSLHDALPISGVEPFPHESDGVTSTGAIREAHQGLEPGEETDAGYRIAGRLAARRGHGGARSEEHTSELQSRQYLVCRLMLEKKTK